jgi:putative serine protease PepD
MATALAGAVFAFGLSAVLWRSERSPDRVEGVGASTTAAAITVGGAGGSGRAGSPTDPVARLAERLSPSIMRVTAWRGSDARYASALAYRADGLAVTSAAVIQDADAVTVLGPNGEPVAAEVLGTDPENDLALLRLDLQGILAFAFGEQVPDVQVGSACLLLGASHPTQEGTSVTEGRVSALGKVVPSGERWLVGAIEFEASAVPAMAGGALVDPSGRLIGVVVANPEGAAGRPLAVPTAAVARSAQQLLEEGRVSHPWLGVVTVDATIPASPTATEPTAGARVEELAPEGPAEVAGLEPGDVVVALEGEPVSAPWWRWR